METVTSNIERLRYQTNQTLTNISSLKKQKTEKLSAFGNSMHAVKRDIDAAESAGQWRGNKPVGPIGNPGYFIIKEFMLKLQIASMKR